MKKGFTLVELLIVIAIIGLVIISIVGAVKKEEETTTKSEYDQCQERAKSTTLKDMPAMCLKYYEKYLQDSKI